MKIWENAGLSKILKNYILKLKDKSWVYKLMPKKHGVFCPFPCDFYDILLILGPISVDNKLSFETWNVSIWPSNGINSLHSNSKT